MALADRFLTGPEHRPFRRLAAALATSQIGDWVYNVALLGVVYARTGSATWVALSTAARVVKHSSMTSDRDTSPSSVR